MKRTTVFLPEALKTRLAARARERGCSEAELIREGIEIVTAPKPTIPLFSSDDPMLADPARLDEAMEGFGED